MSFVLVKRGDKAVLMGTAPAPQLDDLQPEVNEELPSTAVVGGKTVAEWPEGVHKIANDDVVTYFKDRDT